MDEKKVQDVFSDEEFVTSLLKLDTAEEVQAAVKGKGLDLSIEEIGQIKAQLASGNGELTADDLDSVAGGLVITASVLAVIGCIATVAGATATVGGFINTITRARW